MPGQLGAGVHVIDINQHTLAQGDILPAADIGPQGVFFGSAAVQVICQKLGQFTASELLVIGGGGRITQGHGLSFP